LRYLADNDFNVFTVCNNSPSFLNQRDLFELNKLIELREELRWKREDKKSELIEAILDFSMFDNVVRAWEEGDQELANILRFQEIIDGWEEDNLISYSEFLDRINYYREEGGEFEFASLADQEDKEAVKITTVHSAKGLDFPIEFVYYPERQIYGSLTAHEEYQEGINIKRRSDDNLFVTLYIDNFVNGNKIKPKLSDAVETNEKVFDWLACMDFAEVWRLFYVALTRAKDHLFLPKKPDSARKDESWELQYRKKLTNNSFSGIEIDLLDQDFIERAGGEEDFELENPVKEKPKKETFIPERVNSTHLYDLKLCPRLYQFIELKILKEQKIVKEKREQKQLFLEKIYIQLLKIMN